MTKHVSDKTYQKFRSYLMSNLDSQSQYSVSHSQVVKELSMARSTLQLCVKRMHERDDEWDVMSGGNKPGEPITNLTVYRHLKK